MNFTYIKSLNHHNNPVRWLILLSSFYRQGDQGIEKLNYLPKVTQLVWQDLNPGSLAPASMLLTTMTCCLVSPYLWNSQMGKSLLG